MQQLLPCARCARADMIDLGLPADLCGRCLGRLGWPGPEDLTDEHLTEISNAACHVGEGRSWEQAAAAARRRSPDER